ncbi:hypothetical protein ACWEV4_22910 [Streptomyces sp. NPDC003860]
MNLRIIDEIPCASVEFEFDSTIPLQISWGVSNQYVQPVYAVFSGVSGGYVEIRVNPQTGALLEVTVVDAPPGTKFDDIGHSGSIEMGMVPVFDLDAWGERLHGFSTGERALRGAMNLKSVTDGNRYVIKFSEDSAVKRICCGVVSVGVSADGLMTDIAVTSSRQDEVGQI